MGDTLSKRLPNSGRIILSQISSASAIPLAAILLLALPDDPSTMFVHVFFLFITGFCISWNAPATNNNMQRGFVSIIDPEMILSIYREELNHELLSLRSIFCRPERERPIFAEIVPEKSRTSIYALDRSFESIFSSFAPPFPKDLKILEQTENAASLAKALYTAIGIPMALCCFIYSFLYCTYPRDRERARMEALKDSELQLVELDTSPTRGQNTQGHFREEEEEQLHHDDRTIVEMDYGEDGLDFDETDDKLLIYRQLTFSNLGE
ncbi:unnamed protein product [Ilex paraguariensis]|uniref:Uncharacterized protein n=1 Tax=Ilex paraguariensis TaxID=185542 RepID=A0ABC8SGM8_9AQUA